MSQVPWNIYPRPYYHFFVDGYKRGRTKSTRFFTQTILSDFGDEYEVFRHGDNYISILKNGEQVALLHRDRREDNGRAFYDGHYQDGAIDPAMIMLWVEYVDVSFFPMRGLHSTVIREYKFFRREPFRDRVKWMPKERLTQEGEC